MMLSSTSRLFVLAVVLAAPACMETPAVPPSTPAALPSPAPPSPPTATMGTKQAAPSPSALTPSRAAPESTPKAPETATQKRGHARPAWVSSNVIEKWRTAIEGYAPNVVPGNQHALGTAIVPFAHYLNGMHNRIHPFFVDYLEYLDTLPATHPLGDPHLTTRVEIVLNGDGRIQRIGVTRTSGITTFDGAVLDAIDQAQPFGPTPSVIRSPDGNVYLHWEFHRDEVFACSTMNARPFLIQPIESTDPGSAPTPSE